MQSSPMWHQPGRPRACAGSSDRRCARPRRPRRTPPRGRHGRARHQARPTPAATHRAPGGRPARRADGRGERQVWCGVRRMGHGAAARSSPAIMADARVAATCGCISDCEEGDVAGPRGLERGPRAGSRLSRLHPTGIPDVRQVRGVSNFSTISSRAPRSGSEPVRTLRPGSQPPATGF